MSGNILISMCLQRNPEAEDSLLLGEQDMEVEDDAPATEIMNTPNHMTGPPTPPAAPSTPSLQQFPSLPSWVREDITPLRPPTAPPFRPQSRRLARIESELNQAREDVERKDRSIEVLRAQLEALGAAMHRRGDGDG